MASHSKARDAEADTPFDPLAVDTFLREMTLLDYQEAGGVD